MGLYLVVDYLRDLLLHEARRRQANNGIAERTSQAVFELSNPANLSGLAGNPGRAMMAARFRSSVSYHLNFKRAD